MSETIYQPRRKAETFEGEPCKTCGGTLRYVCRKKCVLCKLAYAKNATAQAYRSTPEWKARKAAHDRTPDIKEHHRLRYQRERVTIAEYNQRPEIKARKKELALQAKYGITMKEYDRLFFLQKGRCAICPTTLERDRDTHVDHDHNTGKVRGLLCGPCNRAIGLLQDDPQRCKNAATYLETAA